MRKTISLFLRTIIFIFIVVFLFPLSCTKEYRVEIAVEDWSYDQEDAILYVDLVAKNTGEISIKNINCTVSIRSTFTPYNAPIASKSVSFDVSELSVGASTRESIIFRELYVSSLFNYAIEIEDISADPVTDVGCDNPIF
jgi:hypothetical protein